MTDFECTLKGMVDKWDPVPGPQNPQDFQDPLGFYCKLNYKSTLNKGSNKIKTKKPKDPRDPQNPRDHPGPSRPPPLPSSLGTLRTPLDLRDPPELPGPSGTLETSSNFWDPVEPLGTLRIFLGPAWNHRYFSGCDRWKGFLRNNVNVFYI